MNEIIEIIVNCQIICHNGGMATDERVKVHLALPEDTKPFFEEIYQKTGLSPVDFVRLVFNMKAGEVAKSSFNIDTQLPQQKQDKTSQ